MKHIQIYYPPHKMYAFDRGWDITGAMMGYFVGKANENVKKCSQYIGKRFDEANYGDGTDQFLAWLSAIFLVPYMLLQYVVLLFSMGVLVVAHTLLLVILMGLALFLIGILRLCTRLYHRVYGIYYRCPRAYCYYEMPVPSFICPKCKAIHSRLWPDTYGIFLHRCGCDTKLPTLDFLGRKKLDRICPECRAPLNPEYGKGTNIDIPVIGGPSAGKTNYIIMAINALMQTHETLSFSFVELAQRQHFEASIRKLQQGERLAKTPDVAPEAFNLKIETPGARVPKLLFMYDAAGEAFSTDSHMNLQAYYKYIRGMIIVIDPCAISSYRRYHLHEIEPIHDSLGPSKLDVEEVCNRMLRTVEMYRVEGIAGQYSLPVAVALTKVDALGLENEVGLPAAQQLLTCSPSSMTYEDAINVLVQNFFRQHGLSNFMDQLESRFSEVRYFSCSALGRLPTNIDKSAFVSVRVLDPLVWLLSRTGVIKEAANV